MPTALSHDPESILYFPPNYFDLLDLEAMFPGRSHLPLDIDIGCGDGTFLIAMASREPERNFIGIEELSDMSERKAHRCLAGTISSAI